jgi:hypothetical protein
MMDPRLVELLDACVQDVRTGQRTVAECIAEHPEHEAELRALLPSVLAMARPPLAIDPRRKLVARQRFVEALYRESRASWWEQVFTALGPQYRMLRVGLTTACLLLVMATALGSAAVAAQDAKPGDLLYPVRTVIEDVQVAAAGPPEARARVRLAIASQHLAEVERAIETQDDENARRAAAAYEEAVARAKAEMERARIAPEAAPELDQALENTRRRQERLAERARERGAVSTEAALERAREQLVVRPPAIQPAEPTRDRPTPSPASPEPTSNVSSTPTSVGSPVSPSAVVIVEVPPTPAATATPQAPGVTATPGSVRGVLVPPQEIARAPANRTPVSVAAPPPTPTLIGVAGIPAADPRGPVIFPPVPPRNGIGNGQPQAPSIPSPRDPPPAIAMDPRGFLTPVPPSMPPADQARAAEIRATPARPEDPRAALPERVDPDPVRVPPDPRALPAAGPPVAMQPPLPGPGFSPAPPVQAPPAQVPSVPAPFAQAPPAQVPPAPAGGPLAQPAASDAAPAPAAAPAAVAPPAMPPIASPAAVPAIQQPTPRPTATRTPVPTVFVPPTPVPPAPTPQPGPRINNGMPGGEDTTPPIGASSAGVTLPILTSGGADMNVDKSMGGSGTTVGGDRRGRIGTAP